MIFSSLLFLFWFIPIFFFIYYLAPPKLKNAVLLIGSIAFYAWGEPKYLILIFVSILVNYLAGILMQKADRTSVRRLVLIIALVYDFSMLLVFKYTNFFIGNINALLGSDIALVDITLPLGISFYTFQIASYIIDLYKGKIEADKNIINLATYLCMFPQLIAGPIVVYSEVSEKLKNRNIVLSDIEEGIRIFILGLGSKVLIANNIGSLWDRVTEIGYENVSTPVAWMAMIAYTLQIYFDFNGYSLMAIGLGKMLGFTFPQNFNFPYISRSLTEFWRRWHITLSSWFREYVYIPLGGNRRGNIRTYVNLFIVWFLTGFWHGASWNFVLWGLFFFMMLSIEKMGLHKILDRHKVFSHIYSLLFISMSWMIFAITDIQKIGVFFLRLFSFKIGEDVIYYFRNYAVIIIIGCILSTPVLKNFYDRYKTKVIGIIISIAILILSVAYLADATYNPFLYFRF